MSISTPQDTGNPQDTGTLQDNYVRIFDTTLRDGEQSPGASLTHDQKVEIAHQLARLGVDVIEAGFPASSAGAQAAVRTIAEEIGTEDGPIITGLARANRGDIDAAWKAVEPARHPRIHTFIATSELHMERKLMMTRDQVKGRVREMITHARGYCDDVEFSPEDGSRSDRDFLIEVLNIVVEAGGTTLNIADTVGYAMPEEYAGLIRDLMAAVPEVTPQGERVIWSVHCHDDLGFGTANAIAGLHAGARQAEVTINGLGERAGNTSLEELVMALHTRRDYYGLTTGIDTRQLCPTSRMVSQATGMSVPPNKAIVGANAFAHEAGIHQDGVLKDKRTYEIMTPESVGLENNQLVLGRHSGRNALRYRLKAVGIELGDTAFKEAFRRFKTLADQRKTVNDADLRELAGPLCGMDAAREDKSENVVEMTGA